MTNKGHCLYSYFVSNIIKIENQGHFNCFFRIKAVINGHNKTHDNEIRQNRPDISTQRRLDVKAISFEIVLLI